MLFLRKGKGFWEWKKHAEAHITLSEIQEKKFKEISMGKT
jgi:hypothetical protein